MFYKTLGKSGFTVSVISFGAWQIGDPEFWGDDSDSDPEGAVAAAVDAGINLFDTAELYGNGFSEEVVGKALRGKRDNVYVATKITTQNCTRDKVRTACENSLRRLGTDWIDLYQIHWPFDSVLYGEVFAVLEDLKKEGKIREIGLSNFGPRDLEAWMQTGSAVSNQIGYNLLFRAPEYEMIPASQHYGLGILVYMPLMQGLLTGRYAQIEDIPIKRRRTRHFSCVREGTRHGESGYEEILMDTLEDLRDFADAINVPLAVLSLRWLIHQPGVTSVIVGARKPSQLLANLAASELDIGPAAIAQLNEFTYPLKIAMGHNCDMWESETNKRIH